MIYIVLPAYNEERGLAELLPQIKKIFEADVEKFTAVIVDDGSADKTSEIARLFSKEMPIRLFTFSKNRGVGEVFRTAFDFVCQDSAQPQADICIALDSDNTQDPGVMLAMIKKIHAGEDIVIASRFEGEGKMIGCPWHRYLYSLGVSLLMRFVTRLPGVKDYSIFYRAYRVSILKLGFKVYGNDLLSGKGFAVMAGLLLKLSNLTTRISEVPLILRYDLKQGTSGNKIARTIRGYLELIFFYIKSNRFRKPYPFSPKIS